MQSSSRINRYLFLGVMIFALLIVGVYSTYSNVFARQADSASNPACDSVRYMIEQGITPYDLGLGGGILNRNLPHATTLASGHYADIWYFALDRDRTNSAVTPISDITILFTNIDDDTVLEGALFQGIIPRPDDSADTDFQPIVNGESLIYPLRDTEELFTFVVRRTDIRNDDAIDYTINAQFQVEDEYIVGTLRDQTIGQDLTTAPTITGGYFDVDLPASSVRTHIDTLTGVAGYNGEATFLTYADYTLFAEGWIDRIDLLGGDLSISGTNSTGQIRQFYLENFDYRDEIVFEEVLTVIDNDGHTIRLNWDFITGVWITDECAGFRVQTDTETYSFVGTIDPNNRNIIFEGNFDEFRIRLQTRDGDAISRQHTINMAWGDIVPDSQTELIDGIFHTQLLGSAFGNDDTITRDLIIEASDIQLSRELIPQDDGTQATILRVSANELETPDETPSIIRTDWHDIQAIDLSNDDLTFTFITLPRTQSNQRGTDLLTVNALDETIHIVYRGLNINSRELGEQRLLTSSDYGYVEIITPEGLPQFEPTTLPNNIAYSPRGLNNTGGECYPVNTLLPEANCPPNGYINPANGNLWYAVTDHIAYGNVPMGDPFNLTLTRSYNSLRANVDGAFGLGWTSEYLLDYNVLFDQATSSRQISVDEAHNFPVGLNVIYAPRGYVTYITPSGSQHVFVSENNNYTTGELRALTMQGWRLNRTRIGGEWTLTQDNGLTYRFDPVGRLLSFGYQRDNRIITIDYPYSDHETPNSLPDTTVIVSDDRNQRQLELIYDTNGHIIESRLRDMTNADANRDDCLIEDGCFVATYDYDDNLLVRVNYPDGQTAEYDYDNDGQLVAHDDPRAPITPQMEYDYIENEDIGCVIGCVDESRIDTNDQVWQRVITALTLNPAQTIHLREATVTDHLGNQRIYQYLYDANFVTRREAGTIFTLNSVTSPLDNGDINDFDSRPFSYEWDNGLLRTELARVTRNSDGRNSIVYGYTPSGEINTIDMGYPTFRVTYNADGVASVNFSDGTSNLYSYYADDGTNSTVLNPVTGRLQTFIDRNGAIYAYEYGENQITVVRGNDNTVTRYHYNPVGLIQQVDTYLLGDEANAYTVMYHYDGLGRLTEINDSIDEFASVVDGDSPVDYRIEYHPPTDDFVSTISVTDITRSITHSHFDWRGRLIETTISPYSESGETTFLRSTTYDYDELDRITRVTEWISPPTEDNENGETIITSYTYDAVPRLPSVDGSDSLINGYAIAECHGEPNDNNSCNGTLTRRHTYDAFDRIRAVEDNFGHIIRYEYDTLTTPILGFQITAYEASNETQFRQTAQYIFDAHWQLIDVSRDGGFSWDLAYGVNSLNLQSLTSQAQIRTVTDNNPPSTVTHNLLNQTWGGFTQGNPAQVDVLAQIPIDSNRFANQISRRFSPTAEMDIAYDFLGRPQQIVDGADAIFNRAYCVSPNHHTQTITYRPQIDTQTPLEAPCQIGDDTVEVVTYDAQGRLLAVINENGERTYTYEAHQGFWEITVTFGQNDNSPSWRLTYDSVGNLLEWRDENLITRLYTYDALGRLTRVFVERQPEASFSFTYNDRNLLTQSRDDLGRGTRYAYNQQGQLTVEQDIRTSNATIYGYNANGLLTTVISPLGNTTTYLYEDRNRPERLTGIIGSTGNLTRFDMGNEPNQLIVTDPRNNQTIYTFDTYGRLWRIDDALPDRDNNNNLVLDANSSRELVYDDAGNLISWQRFDYVPREGNPIDRIQQFDINNPSAYNYSVSANDRATESNWQRNFEFNALGQLTQVNTLNGAPLTFDYDALGRLIDIQSSAQTWMLSYATAPARVIVRDDDNTHRILNFDALNRLTEDNFITTSATTTYNYLPGRNAEVDLIVNTNDPTMPDDRIITFVPGEDISRPQSIILRASGQRRTYVYYANGLLSEIRYEVCIDLNTLDAMEFDPLRPDDCIRTNPEQVWRTSERFIYDALGRPTRYIDREQNIAVFAYDDVGNLINYQNVAGQTFNYVYNEINQLIGIAGPTGTRLVLNYDPLGNVDAICRTRVEAPIIREDCEDEYELLESYDYDTLGRLITQSFPNADGEGNINYDYVPETGLLTNWLVNGEETVIIDQSNDGLDSTTSISVTTPDSTQMSTIAYNTINQIESITDTTGGNQLAYTYDEYGRLTSLTVGDHQLEYDYALLEQGYSIRDVDSGATLFFGLDDRGLLSTIDYNPTVEGETNDAPLVNIDYLRNPNGRIIVAQIAWSTGQLVEIQLDRESITRSITYSQPTLFVDYGTDASGRIQRRSIVGIQQLFGANQTGYITLIGYDNDGRPVTMRITDRTSGDLLYLLTITYSQNGQREVETYQNGGDPAVTISYNYTYQIGNSNVQRSQLHFQTISVGNDIYSYEYHYTPAGNVDRITQVLLGDVEENVCMQFTYDGFNRLIGYQSRDGITQTYAYDVYNRLLRAGSREFIYSGDSDNLIAVYDADLAPVMFGQSAPIPAFFTAQGDTINWLVNDGINSVLTNLPNEDVTTVDINALNNIGIYDPFGRNLPLQFNTVDDNCVYFDSLSDIADLHYPNAIQPDMIWDPVANLYFNDGRVYMPLIGRYLQRDPQGPDVFGNIYNYPSREATPPISLRPPAYTEGLLTLSSALQDIQRIQGFTADNIMALQHPSLNTMQIDPLYNNLQQTRAITSDQLTQQLAFPSWLANNYNLPSAYIDEQGALRLPVDNTPANGGLPDALLSPYSAGQLFTSQDTVLPTIGLPLARLAQYTQQPYATNPQFSNYVPNLWQPQVFNLESTWTLDIPRLSVNDTPEIIFEWLPYPMEDPTSADITLEIVETLLELPTRTGESWVINAFDVALPTDPEIPTEDGIEWLSNWFTDDTLGVANILNNRYPQLPSAETLNYAIGDTPSWVEPD